MWRADQVADAIVAAACAGPETLGLHSAHSSGPDVAVQKTRESKDKAAAVHKRGRANFCLTCLVMLIIGLLFAGGSA